VVTLVTGASGTTGRRVADGLATLGVGVRRASRSGDVRFDWADPATHDAAFDGTDAVYVVAPMAEQDPAAVAEPVLARALERGLRRIVLLSSSQIEPSDHGLGRLARFVRQAPEWTVLRPSWFAQNFTGRHPVAAGVRSGRVVTATGDGRVPFVDAADIAAVAVRALAADDAGGEQVITGPEALSYDDACRVASSVLGRPVVHESVRPEQFTELLVGAGLPRSLADVLAAMDASIAAGAEDRVTDTVERLTGRPPRSLREVVSEGLVPDV
jgi:uncharacterized protein YbjT (DUF2867 family)